MQIEYIKKLLDKDYLLGLPCPERVHKQEDARELRHLFYHHISSILGWKDIVLEGHAHGISPLLYKLVRQIWSSDGEKGQNSVHGSGEECTVGAEQGGTANQIRVGWCRLSNDIGIGVDEGAASASTASKDAAGRTVVSLDGENAISNVVDEVKRGGATTVERISEGTARRGGRAPRAARLRLPRPRHRRPAASASSDDGARSREEQCCKSIVTPSEKRRCL